MAQAQPARKRRRLNDLSTVAASNQDSSSQKNEKDRKIECMACSKELQKDHIGIVCVGDHHLCTECSKNYVNAILEEPAEHIPLKCTLCKSEVIAETFERQLDTQQAQTFILFNMQYNPKLLAANEVVASCPFCEYFEINTKDAGRLIFLCKKEACMKSSCIWCKKLIQQRTQRRSRNRNRSRSRKNGNGDEEESKYDMKQEEVEAHFECAQLAPFKEKWDAALSDGNTRSCPECGVAGMKNNACTHMTCVKCRSRWCYVCGLAEDALDKDADLGGMFGHNAGWKTNVKRCPMWLDNVHQVDARWPKDDSDECVVFLHRLRTKQLLKNVIQEIGDANFAALCKKYRVDQTCGFDLNEVVTGEHTLIVRKQS